MHVNGAPQVQFLAQHAHSGKVIVYCLTCACVDFYALALKRLAAALGGGGAGAAGAGGGSGGGAGGGAAGKAGGTGPLKGIEVSPGAWLGRKAMHTGPKGA